MGYCKISLNDRKMMEDLRRVGLRHPKLVRGAVMSFIRSNRAAGETYDGETLLRMRALWWKLELGEKRRSAAIVNGEGEVRRG